MSEKVFEEKFWSKIEKDGGFKLGEMIVISARSGEGKTTFAHDYLLEVARDKNIPVAYLNLECTKARDYNGPQCEFDFDAENTTLD